MPRNRNRKTRTKRTKKQKVINMVGCYNRNTNLGNTRKGGSSSGCGPYGCPINALSLQQMNQYGGFPLNSVPRSESPMGPAPILGVGQNGGTCGMCQQPLQTGGNFYKPPAPVPGPFVGSAWGAPISEWPGMNGVGGDRNYLANYDAKNAIIGNDPALQMTMNDAGYRSLYSKIGGGKKTKKNQNRRNRNKKGGGLIPQDLVNFGNNISYNLGSAYNSLNGYPSPTNPLPYKDQLTNTEHKL